MSKQTKAEKTINRVFRILVAEDQKILNKVLKEKKKKN